MTVASNRSRFGSSPLARGTLFVPFQLEHIRRFIPAGAGNTPACCGSSRPSAVHPRWRGEHKSAANLTDKQSGSSPLARGTPEELAAADRQLRFIPAGAGNTGLCSQQLRHSPVHPRWRGEHNRAPKGWRCCGGSSPLARGTPFRLDNGAADRRFIPAGAGNTPAWTLASSNSPVHPRWRGEHGRCACAC